MTMAMTIKAPIVKDRDRQSLVFTARAIALQALY